MKILVVEDHPIVVAGCRALFSDDKSVTLVEAANAQEGRDAYRVENPNIAVIDINLPDGSGFDLTGDILSIAPTANILIFTMSDAPVLAARAMDCGARGFISKNDDPVRFRKAIETVASGETFLPDEVAQKMALLRVGKGESLVVNARETDILRLMARGKSMSEIASELSVSYKTISTDCIALRQKLNARTPMELVRVAVEQRLI